MTKKQSVMKNDISTYKLLEKKGLDLEKFIYNNKVAATKKLTFLNKEKYNSKASLSHDESLIGDTTGHKQTKSAKKETSVRAFGNMLKMAFKNNNFNLVRSSLDKIIGFSLVLILIMLLSSCNQKTKSTDLKYGDAPTSQTTPVYHFSVHALYNPVKLMQAYQPLIDYLNRRLKGAQISLEASRDYTNFEQKYKNRKPEFLLPNPWQTLQAIKKGYVVIAMVGEPKDFKGIFIVRKDGGISKPSDLIGKAVSYPSSTALAACIMPQYFLHTHGINVNKDIKNRYVGSQESTIMNVYMKMTSAGAVWPTPWRAFQKEYPKEASELKVIWETETLINNSVMVRNDISLDIRNQVQKYLIELDKTAEGKKILDGMETARFLPATDKDYDVVKIYIERFEKEIRKVETK